MSASQTTTTANGVGATPIALHPWPADSANDEKLVDKLARISAQNGQFRHVTEDSLLKRITDEAAGISRDDNGDESEDGDSLDKRKEHIRKSKGEMFKHINDAQQSVLYIKDFLSLLLSGSSQRAAQTLSQAVRESGVPQGSVAFDKWPFKPPTESQQKQRDLAAKGWRMEGLKASMDSLLNASVKLNNEVRRETKYWDQILKIADKGWSVRRTREPGTLGVQFGFAESGALFEKRGFAPLRSNEEGNIMLDPRLVRRPQCVRVRISQNGKILGSSRQAELSTDSAKERELEDLIMRARDSLFEEELFHEMTLESRQLLSYNVRFRDHVIVLPIDAAKSSSLNIQSQRQVLIDLVPLDELDEESDGHSEDSFARNILLGLRLLLTHAHSQKLLRRSQSPPVLTDRPSPTPTTPIIRTLLTHLNHHVSISSLRTYFHDHRLALSKAGLNLSYTFAASPALASLSRTIQSSLSTSPSSSTITPLLNTLLQTLTLPLTTKTTFTLTTPHSPITLTTTTALAPPTHGTETTIRIPRPLAGVVFPDDEAERELVFTSVAEVTGYLDHVIGLDLAHNVAMGVAAAAAGKEGKEAGSGKVRWIWEAQERRAELVRVAVQATADYVDEERQDGQGGSSNERDEKDSDSTTSVTIDLAASGRLSVTGWGAGGAVEKERVEWRAESGAGGGMEKFEEVMGRMIGVGE
ncbi:hypothetical protein K490DRAFT_68144 [Saccharata proteae CBS 121410]|uniref:Mediator of RNA polymerase II transcription subunit 17 n=1 Tax=Saccharata proteae CBS 121410 TaxID=1314787 RepID=A0A9P4HQS7_9PEZI|nr:hypothetical protein K490DRAFT_68144 [Saccharata proteae CBS 121410]